jgi:hypothetical protein
MSTFGRHSSERAALAKLPLIQLRYQGHPIGLYAVRKAGQVTMSLRPGPVDFPAGTQLLVEDLVGVYRGSRPRMFCATVTSTGSAGMSLAL